MFDVGDYTYGLEEIARHMHRNLKIPETRASQKRLLTKWQIQSADLHAATTQDSDITNKKQLEKISLLVDFAFATHPFYHQLYKQAGYQRGDIASWKDYDALPSITKQDVIQNFELFKSANLAPTIDECYTSMTSGSSGQVLTAMFDSSMIDEDMMRCMRFYEQMLGRTRNTAEWLYQIYVACPPFTSLDGAYPTFTVSNECDHSVVFDHLKQLKPAILSGLPSYLERLGELITDPQELGIKAINTNSEASTEAQRLEISKMFGAKVYDEYSSVELGLIATQCREGKYHIVEDNVRVDVLSPDSQGMGEIVTTSLINSFMPFIRYRQGDIIKIHSDNCNCGCGNKFRHLESFMGRRDQFLYSKKIGKIAPDKIMALYDRILLTANANLAQFQIVQKAPNLINVIVVSSDKSKPVNPILLQSFSSQLKSVFQDTALEIEINELDEMPPEASYKRRLIKCEIDPSVLGF